MFLLIITGTLIYLSWMIWGRQAYAPELPAEKVLPVTIATLIPVSSTATIIPTGTPTIPLTIETTALPITATITRIPHSLDSMIGTNPVLIIHRVRQGDTIESLAYRYKTNAAVIQALNYNLSIPLLVHKDIVIPVNRSDAGGLPEFEVYRVQQDTSAEELGTLLGVDPDELCYYNGLTNGAAFIAGEWVIVPR
ncbi:MAG: LysM peptidoglycan-binding domain-containing protein [Anaerolineales bacterium]|nr:LysM peptidoglycan-binding domain-containing protein [Anaerolineales bacterium]